MFEEWRYLNYNLTSGMEISCLCNNYNGNFIYTFINTITKHIVPVCRECINHFPYYPKVVYCDDETKSFVSDDDTIPINEYEENEEENKQTDVTNEYNDDINSLVAEIFDEESDDECNENKEESDDKCSENKEESDDECSENDTITIRKKAKKIIRDDEEEYIYTEQSDVTEEYLEDNEEESDDKCSENKEESDDENDTITIRKKAKKIIRHDEEEYIHYEIEEKSDDDINYYEDTSLDMDIDYTSENEKDVYSVFEYEEIVSYSPKKCVIKWMDTVCDKYIYEKLMKLYKHEVLTILTDGYNYTIKWKNTSIKTTPEITNEYLYQYSKKNAVKNT